MHGCCIGRDAPRAPGPGPAGSIVVTHTRAHERVGAREGGWACMCPINFAAVVPAACRSRVRGAGTPRGPMTQLRASMFGSVRVGGRSIVGSSSPCPTPDTLTPDPLIPKKKNPDPGAHVRVRRTTPIFCHADQTSASALNALVNGLA